MTDRFRNVDAVKKEVTALVSRYPGPVSDVADALRFIVTEENIRRDAPSVCLLYDYMLLDENFSYSSWSICCVGLLYPSSLPFHYFQLSIHHIQFWAIMQQEYSGHAL
jgi:hypothetical protein